MIIKKKFQILHLHSNELIIKLLLNYYCINTQYYSNKFQVFKSIRFLD